MTAAIVVFVLGMLLVIIEYRAATAPDPKDKVKRRKPLALPDKVRLRGLIFVTFAVAGGAWWVVWFFGD